MSQVDWLAIYNRYLPLVERVASRSEFSDLIWEMQGELGTSHAYEVGGDYRQNPRYLQGKLGASFDYDAAVDGWRITEIARGDTWDERRGSPLRKPGIEAQAGDVLLAINGRRLSREFSPQMALVDLAGEEVLLTFLNRQGVEGEERKATRSVQVRTLADEQPLRYRDWVEGNRQRVHDATGGRVGYVHIPDMGPHGYAEFHRGYLAEVDREALIVDVRFNGGGHVSQLILEKLARRRLGYDVSRWGQLPEPYPMESVLGPIVALTNEQAGSDGDIFSHGFKMMSLGPLIGKRTWGGVVGISRHQPLVDGTLTTQPEFSFWFHDVGWGIENYGADPDIEVDNRPQDYAAGVDAQLDRAVSEILRLLEQEPPRLPEFGPRPDRSLPVLPPRRPLEA
jgi:tricorn protease